VSSETLDVGELAALTGVPETRLDPTVVDELPSTTPGPTWRVRMSNLLWWHRATDQAASVLPVPLRARRGRQMTTAGFIRYAHTPVGPYDEVMASPLSVEGGLLGRVHIPFIAVDSLPSIHAGRAHWALPKVPATFEWSGPTEVKGSGDGWWLGARVVSTGPRIPLLGRSSAAQVRPDGRVGISRLSMRGHGRLVTVEVDVDPDASYAGWLRSGRHRGIMGTSVTLTMRAARWS
jgi:hypothetical protein